MYIYDMLRSMINGTYIVVDDGWGRCFEGRSLSAYCSLLEVTGDWSPESGDWKPGARNRGPEVGGRKRETGRRFMTASYFSPAYSLSPPGCLVQRLDHNLEFLPPMALHAGHYCMLQTPVVTRYQTCFKYEQ